jgi:hypothetical protein
MGTGIVGTFAGTGHRTGIDGNGEPILLDLRGQMGPE